MNESKIAAFLGNEVMGNRIQKKLRVDHLFSIVPDLLKSARKF
jgi:hypothetical protein